MMGAIPGSREPDPCSTGSGPSGFDPERDGFNKARLLWVLAHLAEKLSKETALLSYGAWNPLFCSDDASEMAIRLFTEVREYLDHYAGQAAIAMEALQGRDAKQLDGEAATARAEGIAPDIHP
jgi:hypothetical protein